MGGWSGGLGKCCKWDSETCSGFFVEICIYIYIYILYLCVDMCVYIYHCTLIDTYSLKILWMHFPIHIYQLSFWGHGAVTNHLVNFRKHASREGKEAD